ncbi:MAG: hypothetical protein ACOY3M_06485 [Patescibacteria group bacterium]
MPKKTKKEKLLASARRSHLAPIATHAPATAVPLTPANSSFSFSLSTGKASSRTSVATEANYSLIKKALVKTVLITVAILVCEFLLTSWLPR